MANKKPIPKPTEKLIYQQAGSRCSFCGFDEIDALDIHHIIPRSKDGSNEPGNLVLACKNCHARIHSRAIPESEVRRVKASQGAVIHRMPGAQAPLPSSNVISITGDATGSIVGNSITIQGDAKLRGKRMNYPVGSVGADLVRKNYVAYLAGRYNDFRATGLASYGQKGTHHHGVIHTQIKSRFKVAGTYYVPVERFEELVRFLQDKIDQTIQGKRNKARGGGAYSSFEDYVREQQGG